MHADDSDEEAQEEVSGDALKAVKAKIQSEITLLPPLLPLKFGNGFLLQYIVNYPGVDDKFFMLELGLITGMTRAWCFLLLWSSTS